MARGIKNLARPNGTESDSRIICRGQSILGASSGIELKKYIDAVDSYIYLDFKDGDSGGNYGYVYLPATDAGWTETAYWLKISNNFLTRDGWFLGVCEILGRWGTTDAIAWGYDMPLCWGFVNLDNTDAGAKLFLTRSPCMRRFPTANYIGKNGTAPATSHKDNVLICDSTVATASYANKPCIIMGYMPVTINVDAHAAAATTVRVATGQTIPRLRNNGVLLSGLGSQDDLPSRLWLMPYNQMGAAAGTYIHTNGGTAPTYTSRLLYQYKVDWDGNITCEVDLNNAAGGVPGAGAFNLILAAPAACSSADTGNSYPGYGKIISNGLPNAYLCRPLVDNLSRVFFLYQTSVSAATYSLLSHQSGDTRTLWATFHYSSWLATPPV